MRALSVVNCQSTMAADALRRSARALASLRRVSMSSMRRSRHGLVKTPSAISAL
jgi:hypothetical protein